MGLFVCDKCGCVENTALGRYWSKDFSDMWEKDNEGLALCSECAPLYFADGSRTRYMHQWHEKFEKKLWDGKESVLNRPKIT